MGGQDDVGITDLESCMLVGGRDDIGVASRTVGGHVDVGVARLLGTESSELMMVVFRVGNE